ncbi:MAG: glycoside hydrolase family 3 C-terminal domain-containing protein, partial [Bacteroidota bacterium]|nr:glycoside hydrolase family 3 C-terminal domain-containing protein [Bacteroidota bacterium]
AVRQADVATIMTSANGVNYEFVSDSRKLLTDILKNKWGFKGFVMTDWLQTRSVEKAAFAGLDVSMPGGDNCGFGTALLAAVKAGRVTESNIDDKVRRILGVYDRIGALDGLNISKGAQLNTREHQMTAREIAENGIVLLKNQNNGLPLDKNKIRHILVTGPNADKRFCLLAMGGSSWVESPYEITVLKGIRDFIGEDKVTYISSDDLGGFQVIPDEVLKPVNGVRGFNARYYIKGKKDPVLTRIDKKVDFMWEMKAPDKSINVEDFREARYDAEIIPPVDGKYTFRFISGGGSAIAYNNEWAGAPMAIADPARGNGNVTASVDLKKGIPFHLCVVYSKNIGDAALRIEWETPQSDLSVKKLHEIDKIAKKADAVIYVGGIDHSLDTEGRDRVSMAFPMVQENLINRLAKINRNVNVVLINGSPLEVGGWFPNVRSVLEAWYPGMEGGNAVAGILFGKVNPSGRLPFTWPKKLEDSPSYKFGFQDNDYILYSEKLMVGYRYYDTKNVEPQFPFGYGLSYSDFVYSDLTAETTRNNEVTGSVKVSNKGNLDGYEVVQVYVKPINPAVDRPVHELKYFKKVFVKAGETIDVKFILKQDAFSYYDVQVGDWVVDQCKYELEIGKNSRDIVLNTSVSLKGNN